MLLDRERAPVGFCREIAFTGHGSKSLLAKLTKDRSECARELHAQGVGPAADLLRYFRPGQSLRLQVEKQLGLSRKPGSNSLVPVLVFRLPCGRGFLLCRLALLRQTARVPPFFAQPGLDLVAHGIR